MIGRVHVIPKVEFARRLSRTPDFLDHHFVVSICDPGEERPYPGDHKHLLKLAFCDVAQDEIPRGKRRKYPALSKAQARRTMSFIERCHASRQCRDLVVHCHAGISRSAAVGRFAVELTGSSKRQFRKDHPNIKPKPYVLDLLRSVAGLPLPKRRFIASRQGLRTGGDQKPAKAVRFSW